MEAEEEGTEVACLPAFPFSLHHFCPLLASFPCEQRRRAGREGERAKWSLKVGKLDRSNASILRRSHFFPPSNSSSDSKTKKKTSADERRRRGRNNEGRKRGWRDLVNSAHTLDDIAESFRATPSRSTSGVRSSFSF